MKFINPNIVISNPIPNETKIYNSKTDALYKLLLLIVYCGLGIYFLVTEAYFLGIPLCLLTIFFICKKGKKLIDNKPIVIISKSGIQTADCPFVTWQGIADVKVICKGRTFYLTYKFANGKESINISHLNIGSDDMVTLLGFYIKPWRFVAYER